MSIARVADTITLRLKGDTVTQQITRMSADKVCMGETVYTAADALEIALALVTAATGTVVQRSVTASADYEIRCGNAVANRTLHETDRDMLKAWIVSDLATVIGKQAFTGLAGESEDSIAHRFPFLTDVQAKEVSEYIASLVP